MDLIQVIRDNCNPVSINNLIKLVNILEDLNYDNYMADMYDKVDEALENDSTNVGRFVSNILINHCQEVLSNMGVTMSNEIEDITILEVLQILNFQVLIEYADEEKAQYIITAFEQEDDMDLSYANIISQFTNIPFPRAYQIIDKVTLLHVNTLNKLMTDIISSDLKDESSQEYLLVNIIKELRLSDGFELIGLRLIRNDFDSNVELSQYLRVAGDRINTGVMEETAANFMSLLVLGSDSRFDRLNKYVELCEDLMESEDYKSSVYQRIKDLDERVQILYDKYSIKEDKQDGED